MEFNIKINEVDEEFIETEDEFSNWSNKINSSLTNLTFGTGFSSFSLVLILVRHREGYEHWFKPRKPIVKKNVLLMEVRPTNVQLEQLMTTKPPRFRIAGDLLIELISGLEPPSINSKIEFEKLRTVLIKTLKSKE